MAGIPSGGQKLTPQHDVNAPAGRGGDKWGANGGGIAPCGSETVGSSLSYGETQNNYQPDSTLRAIGVQVSAGALNRQSVDSSIAGGGSTQG